ncbi:class I SAM-dependent methyltransferase [Candidatus Berkelbacteria bacterium]|nr:class I SAM-dependent methyltransferase [Candidatus Berkelbacteria bacterium]
MDDKNVYTDSIAVWYDKIMEAGYLQHEQAANALDQIMTGRKSLLELGIGTGLMAEKMLKRGYEITGIDFTQSMLNQALRRLNGRAELIVGNVIELSLSGTYDAAYSEGGVWIMTRSSQGDISLESHIPDEKGNLLGLENMCSVIKPSGLLVLNIQGAHVDIDSMKLKDNAIYSQRVVYDLPHIHKTYYVKKKGRVVAEQSCVYRRFTDQELQRAIVRCNLEDVGLDSSGQFYVFKKK